MPPGADTGGWISLLPPLLAIALAVWTRRVLVSLFAGLWLGASMLHEWNPLTGLVALIEDFAVVQASDPFHAAVLLLMVCIGGFVRIIVRSGAAEAFAAVLSRLVTNRAGAHGAVWFSGISIFFSDSANPLILGPVFAPLFDRLRISREKLAYLIDSTASPICILVPITSWAAYVVSLVADEYADMGLDGSPMAVYLHSIPFQFYAWTSLLLVPVLGLLGLDYGPMRKAEHSCENSTESAVSTSPQAAVEAPPFSRAMSGMLALGTVSTVIVGALLMTGGFPGQGLVDALMAGQSVPAVTYGFLAGALVLGGLLVVERAMGPRQLLTHWLAGALSMGPVLLILTLAWSLGAVCDALGTGLYVAGVVERTVSPLLVPALVFLVGALISFATGSAWGCFAILIPIALPLATQTGVPMHLVLGAVLSGGVFGDHASPISDTTILSSMGAGCSHLEHVRTQIPYAATAGLAALAGFLLAAVWTSAWTLVPVFALLLGLALFFHRRAQLSS
jgi:Na+/H+ antiporter NhaC